MSGEPLQQEHGAPRHIASAVQNQEQKKMNAGT